MPVGSVEMKTGVVYRVITVLFILVMCIIMLPFKVFDHIHKNFRSIISILEGKNYLNVLKEETDRKIKELEEAKEKFEDATKFF